MVLAHGTCGLAGKLSSILVACAAVLATPVAHAGLVFNFINSTGNATADAAFNRAAQRWSSVLKDNITVNIQRGYSSLNPGVLAAANSTRGTVNYADFRAALIADNTSSSDTVATGSLPQTSIPILINRVSDRPAGTTLSAPFLDNDGSANNTTIYMTSANAKALGLLVPQSTILDASITFSNQFNFDFNPDDGIAANAIDFVGVATHELGHALGFISGVDVLDTHSTSTIFSSNDFTFVSPLDLFRFSAQSITLGAIDFTADTRDKFFSINGGVTSLGGFSTGVTYGDGRQASHLKDNQGLGIMDPTAGLGELLSITALDLKALDVIGYNLFSSTTAVPTPSAATLMLIGLAALMRRRKPLTSRGEHPHQRRPALPF